MPAAWTERRLFLSSTFRDFHAERDHLHAVVFPALQERLAARLCTLVPVDLRWGVETGGASEADAKELLVLRVCLGEIDRCKPFVLALIGDRYGWVPAAPRMTAAAREAGFDADVSDKSVTALEVEYGVLAQAAAERRAFVYLREPLPYGQMPAELASVFSDSFASDAGATDRRVRLQRLRDRVLTEMPNHARVYQAAWDSTDLRVVGLEAWGQQVVDDLWSVLDVDTAAAAEAAPKTWQDWERAIIDAFAAHRGQLVIGREGVLDDLQGRSLSAAEANAAWASVIVAEPGGGKSALFAALWSRLAAQAGVQTLANAAGISPRAGSVDAMLRRFCQELAAASGRPDPCGEEMSSEDVQTTFGEWLTRAAGQRRVVILLDALNEFEDSPTAQHWSWLPARVHRNVRLVATALPCAAVQALTARPGASRIDLAPLGIADARESAAAVCARYRKTLPPAALEALIARRRPDGELAAGHPLWLSLAIDDLLLLDEDDFARAASFAGTPEQRLQALLVDEAERMPDDIAGLYGALFDRAEAVHGVTLTRAFVELLATSRHGLRETDLAALIPGRTGVAWDPLRFANLRRGLRAHVVARGEPLRWDFFHAQAREAVRLRGLADAAYAKGVHAALAAHFGGLSDGDPLRCSDELWHLVGADDRPAAAQALAFSGPMQCDFNPGVVRLVAHSPLVHGCTGAEWVCSLIQSARSEMQWPLLSSFAEILEAEAGQAWRPAILRNIAAVVVSCAEIAAQHEPTGPIELATLCRCQQIMGDSVADSEPNVAREWFEKAATGAGTLTGMAPGDKQHYIRLGGALSSVARVTQWDSVATANKALERAVTALDRALGLDPKSATAAGMMALTLRMRSQIARAHALPYGLPLAERAVLMAATAVAEHKTEGITICLAQVLIDRVEAVHLVDRERALADARQATAVAESLWHGSPGNAVVAQLLQGCYHWLARLDLSAFCGEPDEWHLMALQAGVELLEPIWVDKGLQLAQQLVEFDPDSLVNLQNLIVALRQQATVEFANPARVEYLLRGCLGLAARCAADNNMSALALSALADSYFELGRFVSERNPKQARKYLERALLAMRPVMPYDQERVDECSRLASILRLLAAVLPPRDVCRTAELLEECVSMIQKVVVRFPDDPTFIADLQEATAALVHAKRRAQRGLRQVLGIDVTAKNVLAFRPMRSRGALRMLIRRRRIRL